MLVSALMFTLGNAVGLLLAVWFLPEFTIDPVSFVVAVLLFTVIEVIASPLLTKMSLKNVPAMQGGVALVTTFVGLGITGAVLAGMEIGGITTWLAATLLVWLGALVAHLVLPMFMFKKVMEERR
ncbi:phage holin family protein [Oceanomicrobium pacificus]|nr:phage holin family protein [Oceanomicrobium pacificus]